MAGLASRSFGSHVAASWVLLWTGCGAPEGASTSTGTGSSSDASSGTGEGSDTSDSSSGLDPACFEEPAADASFSLTLDGVPILEIDNHDLVATCTVVGVETLASRVSTTLACDVSGRPIFAVLTTAESSEGAAAWSSGSDVELVAKTVVPYYADPGEERMRRVSMRDLDSDVVLVAAMDGALGVEWLQSFPNAAPVDITENWSPCPDHDELPPPRPMGVDFVLGEASLSLVSGQRGVLPIFGTTERYAVDLAQASWGHGDHYDTWFRLLLQRVT